jgi:hypothetical protein
VLRSQTIRKLADIDLTRALGGSGNVQLLADTTDTHATPCPTTAAVVATAACFRRSRLGCSPARLDFVRRHGDLVLAGDLGQYMRGKGATLGQWQIDVVTIATRSARSRIRATVRRDQISSAG